VHLFLDESGGFVVPAQPKLKIAAVGALVIPDEQLASVSAEFTRLLRQFGATRELKGSELTENQARGVISMLRNYDVVFDASAIDIGHETAESLRAHQCAQADKITESLTPDHQSALVAELNEFRRRLLALPLQLFVQARLTWLLIDRVIRVSTLYYVQARPAELGSFCWRFDAKEPSKVTQYEELWSTLLLPMLQTRSEADPYVMLQGADYSHFERFDMRAEVNGEMKRVTDLRELFRDRDFVQSRDEIGVQLCDMLLSAFTRAFNGTLQTGWEHLGRLMILPQRRRGPDLGSMEYPPPPSGRRYADSRLRAVYDKIASEMRPVLLGVERKAQEQLRLTTRFRSGPPRKI